MRKELNDVIAAVEGVGYEVCGSLAESSCRRQLTEMTLSVCNKNKRPIKVHEDSAVISRLSEDSDFFIIPIQTNENTSPFKLFASEFKMIRRSYMKTNCDLMAKLANELKQNYWVVQNRGLLPQMATELADWVERYEKLYWKMMKASGTYGYKAFEAFATCQEEIEKMDGQLELIDLRIRKSGYFAVREEPLFVLFDL